MVARSIAVIATGLVLAVSSVSAQENGNPAPNAPSAPGMLNQQGQGMKGMGMMGGADHAQMQRMMDNCNRMMESHMQKNVATPDKKG